MNSDDGFDDQLFGRIDQIVTAAVEHGDTPGVVAGVALRSVGKLAGGSGLMAHAATLKRVFYLGSMP